MKNEGVQRSSSNITGITRRIGWGLEPAMHDGHDYLRTTGHLAEPEKDYENFKSTGATVARSGLRTRFANPARGKFDFEDAVRQARAAEKNGVYVYWDLAHYDYPRWIGNPWSDETVDAFVELGVAFADRLYAEGLENFGICVWNEMILWSMWMETGSKAMSLEEIEGRGDTDRHGAWRALGIKATFAVMKAVHERYPEVKFLLAEPSHREGILSLLSEMKAFDPIQMERMVIGLNMYPITEEPFSREPVSYFVPLVRDIRKLFPRNEILIAETSSVGNWGLPDRVAWFQAMLRVQELSQIETMIWYPALDYGAWHDENVLVEHGGWGQGPERIEFSPLIEAVRKANGVLASEMAEETAEELHSHGEA